MNLDFMKLNVEYVEYVKGIESVERKNLRDLEKELEELGWL
jgi:AAA+ ATPase superfamily predicted ATPase